MSKPELDQTPSLNPMFRFQWEEAQNGHVLLYPEGMIKLNDSAGAILAEVNGEQNCTAIIHALETRFPEAGALGPDVLEFLEVAHEQNWIRYV
ncbi:MAG: pyrroloquinoline quinone biosynthesis peptide chaperone PqqD [Oceanospirillales bacterium]|uniref:PqqA binding protein n=1 Tax=Marinobacterium halophilum TaxID=267374 RepID=A0A2P8EZQ3_9GAMM|nr:pyrroloquinoline quinone biosynthesis peptide chaperone PqqD [Marinobacterium halophilum]MBR9828652.1 pyrroloquinoline quinone biosynthesis peptide chaperone PqqD [Oceanospirillales bacterium]PSL14937.1 pyrroloquinoline quinone biosynthesis protein D [Marinobacterium halophilum]